MTIQNSNVYFQYKPCKNLQRRPYETTNYTPKGLFILTQIFFDIFITITKRTRLLKQKYLVGSGSARTKSTQSLLTKASAKFTHRLLFGCQSRGFQQANPTRHLSPAYDLHSRHVQRQPFVVAGVQVLFAVPPYFEAFVVVPQHQPVSSRSN